MRIVLAHGASGNAASMQPHVAGLEARGLDAGAIDLPLRKAEKAVAAYREALGAFPEDPAELIIGGQSYGGRVASLLAAEPGEHVAGLVFFSYPLHRPGHPDWDERSQHWPTIEAPVLFLSGESDPFAKIDLLRKAIDERLPSATLITYPGQGHSLKKVLAEALDVTATFAADVARARA